MFLGERLYKRENAKTNPYLKRIYIFMFVCQSMGGVGPVSLVMQMHDTYPSSFSKTFRKYLFYFSSVNTKNVPNRSPLRTIKCKNDVSYHITVHKDLIFVYKNYWKCVAVCMWLARADPLENLKYMNNKYHENDIGHIV